MRKPDFFIVGAPKCGTTSLYAYLRQHPQIFMPGFSGKEPHYFGRDLTFIGRERPAYSQEKYASYFAKAAPEQMVGEASTWYLYSRTAAEEIQAFNPQAKIIIMLRNPVDVMYALHNQRVYNGTENVADFATALALEEARKQGRRLPPYPGLVDALFYRESVRFSQQIQRYFRAFARDQINIIIFDDFKANTAVAYTDTLQFLNVDPTFQADFRIQNPSKRVWSHTVQQTLLHPPRPARWLLRHAIPLPLRQRLFEALKQINTRYEKRPPLDPNLRRQLTRELAPELERLSQMLGRDLTYWADA